MVISISALHLIFPRTLNKVDILSALIIHEYILTFAREVERFWPKCLRSLLTAEDLDDNHAPGFVSSPKSDNFTWASFFFFLNRYFTIVAHVPIAVRYLFMGDGTKVEVSLS